MAEADTNKPWYFDDISALDEDVRRFFESYCGLKAEDVIPHIEAVRGRAWAVHPYPCIGAYRFLTFSLPWYAPYPRVVATLRDDPTALFLDLGCCVGQELRLLASAGIPSEQLIGADLDPSFFDLGYDLFRDRETFKARFLQADILQNTDRAGESKSELWQYEGKINFIFVGAFLHLFSRNDQLVALSNMIRLLRPTVGTLVLGRQVGNVNPGHYTRKSVAVANFQHDVNTFKELWAEAGKHTGTSWHVEAEMLEWVDWRNGKDLGLVGKEFEKPDGRDLRFWVKRTA